MSSNPGASGHSALHLRVRLVGVYPEVWRRVIVPGSATMANLSEMLLVSMGWELTHSHAFGLADKHDDIERTATHAAASPVDDLDAEFILTDDDDIIFMDDERPPSGNGAAGDFDFEDDDEEDELHEDSISVLETVGDLERFSLEYDFGSGWEHDVAVERVDWYSTGLKFGVCIGGENACPPEDVGGPSGYTEFLHAINDPTHEDHASYLEWIGGSFDPVGFDVVNCNAIMQRVR